MNKSYINKIFILLFILIINFSVITKATNDYMYEKSNEYGLSNQYKKWLELPEEERNKYIMPNVYNTELQNDGINTYSSLLPAKYDLRDYLNIIPRGQGNTNTCWAFSASSMFETTYAKMKETTVLPSYSVRHMDYATSNIFKNNIVNPYGFKRNINSGGNSLTAVAYYTSGQGPILENDMPFSEIINLIDISEIKGKEVQAQLEDFTLYPNIYKNYGENNRVTYSGENTSYSSSQINEYRNKIKSQIMNYGAVGAQTYVPENEEDILKMYKFSEDGSLSYFFNNNPLMITNHNDKILANHAVTIIGWDDNYSKENFNEQCRPYNDGAYIVLNSWKEYSYYYISYDDYFIELGMAGIQKVSDKDYDNIYQYDPLGMSTVLSANDSNGNKLNTMYAANCFKKNNSSNEKILEIGLYIYNDNTDVELYLNNNGTNLNIKDLKYIANAKNLTTGYHVIQLNDPIIINSDFSIAVKYFNNSGVVIPVEMPLPEMPSYENYTRLTKYDTASSNYGESFASFDGIEWTDIKNIEYYEQANACIKVFTLNIEEDDIDYIANPNLKVIQGNSVKMLTGIDEKTTINNLINTNNFKAQYTIKAYKGDIQITTGNVATGTIIKIYSGATLVDELVVTIYGDTSGDGQIESIDALWIIKNKLNLIKFDNEYFEQAGRVTTSTRTEKEKPSAIDALAVVKHKLNIEKINQH